MRISYVSDLHAEFRKYPDLSKDPGGDVLLLAGDIFCAPLLSEHRTDTDAKKLRNWLLGPFKELIEKYDTVLHIAGNHEHYGCIFRYTHSFITKFYEKNGLKVQVMDNDKLDVDGVRFIGSTLWTDFGKGNPLYMQDAETWMNDYRQIGLMDVQDMNYFNRYNSRNINANFILNEHLKSVEYIRYQVDNHEGPVVVMTHHAPSFESIDGSRYKGDTMNHAYASDLADMILDRPNIKYWIHGHTHFSVDYMIGECNVVSNQYGYYNQDSAKIFTGIKSFDLYGSMNRINGVKMH